MDEVCYLFELFPLLFFGNRLSGDQKNITILITGGSGWLGQFVYHELQEVLASDDYFKNLTEETSTFCCFAIDHNFVQRETHIFDVHITYNKNLPEWISAENCHKVDFTSESDMQSCIDACRPDIIIHLAAVSSPLMCEKDPDLAMRVNRPLAFFEIVKRTKPDILFIFTSTDLVYDGEHAPYEVGASLSPLTTYGKTKAAFEQDVLTLENGIVLRLSNMLGPPFKYQKVGCKFFQFLNEAFATREYIGLLHDQIRYTANFVFTY